MDASGPPECGLGICRYSVSAGRLPREGQVIFGLKSVFIQPRRLRSAGCRDSPGNRAAVVAQSGREKIMNSIDGIHSVIGSPAIQPAEAINPSHAPIPLDNITDVVEISTASILAAKVHELPAVRVDLVARMKAEIAAGTFETEERIEATVDRIMDELSGEM